MELTRAMARRRMVRAFETTPIEPALVESMLDRARRAPAAGNTQACQFLVLSATEDRDRYWDTTLPATRRAGFRWQGLLDAPLLVVVTVRPDAYVERYAEADKARPRLGDDAAAWPVPFWWVDAGAVIQNLLLLAVEHGLGACLFGLFDHEAAVAAAFGIPDGTRCVGTVAIGRPRPDEPGRSSGRARPPLDSIVHWGRWSGNES